jgi:hypothetical protein
MSDDTATAQSVALAAAARYLGFLAHQKPGSEIPSDPSVLARGPELERLGHTLRGQPPEVRNAVAERLAAGLTELPDPMAAALVAVQIGSMVEHGVDPAPLGEALRTRLPADFAAARRFVALVEAETGAKRPDEVDQPTLARLGRQERTGASAWAALSYSTPAAMAAWSRHRPSRLAVRSAPGLAEDAAFLGARGGYSFYIGELLAAADGPQLTVIAPEQRKGFIVELEVVRNAAHLFALLEDALVGDPDLGLLTGPRTDPNVAAIARGEAAIEGEGVSFFAIGWHYEYWWGLRPEAAARASGLHPLVAAMIGVEAPVSDLPKFRGRPVILMRPAWLKSRTCDLGFFSPLHDALRSRTTVLRHLSALEVDALCAELRAGAEHPAGADDPAAPDPAT